MQVIPTPDGLLDADRFYQERDSRMIVGGFAPQSDFRVAVGISRRVAATLEGQRALFWLCSMLRRSGRAFSKTTIVSEEGVEGLPNLSARSMEQTLKASLEAELAEADPFGSTEWRAPTANSLDGIAMVVWVGEGFQSPRSLTRIEVAIGAFGWTAMISAEPAPAALLPTPLQRAASSAIAFAAALAVGEVHLASVGVTSDLRSVTRNLWFALDKGQVTSEPEVGEHWMDYAAYGGQAAPWHTAEDAIRPSVGSLLMVGAGGLGLNAAQVLAESYVTIDRAVILDPDHVDISNLNRLIGVGVSSLGQSKAELAAGSLRHATGSIEPLVTSYEQWSVADGVGTFDAVMVGVDQVVTRLEVAADWPRLLVNGGTAGGNWTVSAHRPGINGCLGCYYGSARQTYADIHRAVRCAGVGGGMDSLAPPVPVASYPHVTVAAAATMVALLIHAVWEKNSCRNVARAGERRRMQMAAPHCALTDLQCRVATCHLLCSSPHVRAFFAGEQDQPSQ